jgi:hypothetical protein
MRHKDRSSPPMIDMNAACFIVLIPSQANVNDAEMPIYVKDDSPNIFATRNFTHLYYHCHYPSAAKNKQKKHVNL